MTEYEQWQIDSEAASRFYKAVIDIEDKWKWIKLTRFRYIQWKKKRWFKELPPICHAGVVWEELLGGDMR